MLHREWFCVGRCATWLPRLRVAPARRRGRSRAGHQRRGTACCARSTTSAGTAGRRSSRSTRTTARPARTGRPARACAAVRCAAPTTPGPTASPAGCCGARTPRRRRLRPGRVRAAPGGGRHLGRLPLPAPHSRVGAAAGSSLGSAADRVTNYPLADLVVGATPDLRRGGQLQGRPRELQRVLPLRPGPPRAGAGWCRRSAVAAADLDWEDGVPHRDGAWTFTASGTTTRAPLPGWTRHERTRHKGELVYPNLMLSLSADHVAAFALWPTAPDRTTHRLRAAVRAGGGGRRLRRLRRDGLVGPRSTARTGRSASRCSAA